MLPHKLALSWLILYHTLEQGNQSIEPTPLLLESNSLSIFKLVRLKTDLEIPVKSIENSFFFDIIRIQCKIVCSLIRVARKMLGEILKQRTKVINSRDQFRTRSLGGQLLCGHDRERLNFLLQRVHSLLIWLESRITLSWLLSPGL